MEIPNGDSGSKLFAIAGLTYANKGTSTFTVAVASYSTANLPCALSLHRTLCWLLRTHLLFPVRLNQRHLALVFSHVGDKGFVTRLLSQDKGMKLCAFTKSKMNILSHRSGIFIYHRVQGQNVLTELLEVRQEIVLLKNIINSRVGGNGWGSQNTREFNFFTHQFTGV